MSLEAAIAENTALLKELCAQLHRNNQHLEAMRGAPVGAPSQVKKPEEKQPASSTGTTKESPASSAPPATGAEAKPLSYEADVKPKAIALSKKSMDDFKAVLGSFGIAKFPDAKPEQYAEIVQALDEKLAA